MTKKLIPIVALTAFVSALALQAGEKKDCKSCCPKEKPVVLLPPKQMK